MEKKDGLIKGDYPLSKTSLNPPFSPWDVNVSLVLLEIL